MALSASGILFLDRNGFLLYSDDIGRVLQFNFPPAIVRDLEIINHEQFEALVSTFFKQSGLSPFQMIILLSDNLLFEKVFLTPQDENGQKDLEQFMDNLPFEHVGSIIFTKEESKFIATNKDLYQGVSKAFEKLSCVVSAIVPAFIVPLDINQMAQITSPVASGVYRRALSLRQYSFLTDIHKIPPPSTGEKKPEKKEKVEGTQDEYSQSSPEKPEKKSNMRLFVLIGVFGLLLVFLVIAILTIQ